MKFKVSFKQIINTAMLGLNFTNKPSITNVRLGQTVELKSIVVNANSSADAIAKAKNFILLENSAFDNGEEDIFYLNATNDCLFFHVSPTCGKNLDWYIICKNFSACHTMKPLTKSTHDERNEIKNYLNYKRNSHTLAYIRRNINYLFLNVDGANYELQSAKEFGEEGMRLFTDKVNYDYNFSTSIYPSFKDAPTPFVMNSQNYSQNPDIIFDEEIPF